MATFHKISYLGFNFDRKYAYCFGKGKIEGPFTPISIRVPNTYLIRGLIAEKCIIKNILKGTIIGVLHK